MHKATWSRARLMSLLLSLILGLQLYPMAVRAEHVQSEQRAPADLVSIVKPQIRAFADSIDQANANSNMARELASHGMRGKGRALTVGANSSLSATLLNSELVQEGFAASFADIIQTMQRLDMRRVPGVRMSFEWYGTDNSYGAYILTDSKEYPDNLDWMVSKEQYTGTLNAYDNSLEWMVGNCEATVVIQCVEDAVSEKTYRVTATFGDRFDFSVANTSGFKQLLSGIGMFLFREFDWYCTVTMDITVPYAYNHCSHSSGAYHWTFDRQNRTMTSDGSGIYALNNTTHRSKTAADGTVHHYYELDNTVRLYHNKPWVLEYDVRAPKYVVFAPVDNAVTKTHPQITHSANTSLFAVSKDYAMAENTNGNLDRYYAYNYYGTKLHNLFRFASNKTYTFRLENVITGDGHNRIYLSAFETETGACCLDRVAMDDYYYYGGWMTETDFVSEENDWLSRKDIHINYFGTGTTGLDAQTLDLRIWENGRDALSSSYWSETRYPATCTQAGYTLGSCSLCGLSQQTDVVPATGHSFGNWVDSGADSHRRNCTACSHFEARPHSYHNGLCTVCRKDAELALKNDVITMRCPGVEENGQIITAAYNASGHLLAVFISGPTDAPITYSVPGAARCTVFVTDSSCVPLRSPIRSS